MSTTVENTHVSPTCHKPMLGAGASSSESLSAEQVLELSEHTNCPASAYRQGESKENLMQADQFSTRRKNILFKIDVQDNSFIDTVSQKLEALQTLIDEINSMSIEIKVNVKRQEP